MLFVDCHKEKLSNMSAMQDGMGRVGKGSLGLPTAPAYCSTRCTFNRRTKGKKVQRDRIIQYKEDSLLSELSWATPENICLLV